MLSVPTLWVVFMVNFMAMGLIWTYVAKSYPNFEAARYWVVAALLGTAGAGVSVLRIFLPPLVPLMFGAILMIAGTSFLAMGVDRFYGEAARWRLHLAVNVCGFLVLNYFVLVQPSVEARIFVYSVVQSIPVIITIARVFARQNRRHNPGARLTGYIAIVMVAVNVARGVASLFDIGGQSSMVNFNQAQAALVLVLLFLSTAWNFGFVLMAIDRLRSEIASLALSDDLTGTANRRHLFQRLEAECEAAERTGQAFTILAIDLDGFKAINDRFGHGAGDECLRRMTWAVQSRLRPGDLLARSGGDEFCVVLPASTLEEGAMVARRIVETMNDQLTPGNGMPAAISASVGIAQWTPQVSRHPEQLLAMADQALYAAKNEGKNRCAIFESGRAELRRSA